MALITYNPAYKGHRAQVVPRAKALEIDALLHDMPGDLTDEQYEYLNHIERIYHGKPDRRPAEQPELHTDLTHEGVYQSRDMGIPTGDQ